MNRRHFLTTIVSAAAGLAARRPKPEPLTNPLFVGVYSDWPDARSNPLFAATYDFDTPRPTRWYGKGFFDLLEP